MEKTKILVILVILFVILVIFIHEISQRESFTAINEPRNKTPNKIQYHIVPDFVPDINGVKYYNYLSKKDILENLNQAISPGDPISCELVNESIEKNLEFHFRDLQDNLHSRDAILNEKDSIALILYHLKKTDVTKNNNASDVLKFLLLNIIDNFSIQQESNETLHIVILPFILNDENIIKIIFGLKKIYFIGLYKPNDNSLFFNTNPRWSTNSKNLEFLNRAIYRNECLFNYVNHFEDWARGAIKKCDFLPSNCLAKQNCNKYNEIMNTNIINNIINNSSYIQYINREKRRQKISKQVLDTDDKSCVFTENTDTESINNNSKFSFI
jgi:hypothetical protein